LEGCAECLTAVRQACPANGGGLPRQRRE